MSDKLEKEIKKYYDIFQGLPSTNPIVRENQENDAFEILVYKLMFSDYKFEELTKDNLPDLKSCIIPPPDDGIDIFIQDNDNDEPHFKIVQVKNSTLPEAQIKDCFNNMRRTMSSYEEDPKKIKENARKIISESSFDSEYKDPKTGKWNTTYYVIHNGDVKQISDQKDNEEIINGKHLEVLLDSVTNYSVPHHDFNVPTDQILNYEGKNNVKSLVCTMSATDLRPLVEKYNLSEKGRNILFGQNLRDALVKGSKTYQGLKKTIEDEPESFWYYNNGITIIAKNIILKNEKITLTNFSIINGAQTTSAFDLYLEEVKMNNKKGKKRTDLIENLKKTKVLVRIVASDDENFQKNITLYNNTQNPISDRDMVSNNIEQKKLKEKLESFNPKIYLDIRRGVTIPSHLKFKKHRKVENTALAQYIFAGPLLKPFNAKDKKNKIYNKDSSSSYIINKFYDEIFHPDTGKAFKMKSNEIDELLFIKELHRLAKKYHLDSFKERIANHKKDIEKIKEADPKDENIEKIQNKIESLTYLKQINNVNTFYNISLYYLFKQNFDPHFKLGSFKYNFEKFYKKTDGFHEDLVKEFALLFNEYTIKIIKTNAANDAPGFVRAKTSQKIFSDYLEDEIETQFNSLGERYNTFVKKFKIK